MKANGKTVIEILTNLSEGLYHQENSISDAITTFSHLIHLAV